MSFAETAGLGAIAGFTIYLGLPLGRVNRVDDRVRVGLAMFSVGILAFIFMDVTTHGQEIVSATLDSFKASKSGFGDVVGQFALLAVGFTAGVGGIAAVERRVRSRQAPPPIAGGSSPAVAAGRPVGGRAAAAAGVAPAAGAGHAPGAGAGVAPAAGAGAGVAAASATASLDAASAQAAEQSAEQAAIAARRRALQTGMAIATAIGLHNFAEGLAIGVSAKAGAVGLATVLIIGFGLHNTTEGFGIVGPLGGVRPSWRWLGLVGLIGGGPTFLGTLVGFQVHSDALELMFYALAGGAILYVIGEIWTGMRRYGHRTLGLYMIAGGFLLGVATDLVVSYGGG
jgi:zinc transporter, ZIP family